MLNCNACDGIPARTANISLCRAEVGVKPLCNLLNDTLLQLEKPVANVLTELLERNVRPEMTE